MDFDQKVEKAKQVIKETAQRVKPKEVAVAWTGGKDSTTLLHLIREVFSGEIPFRVMFNDSTIEFPEVYDFIKQLTKEWQIDLLWVEHLPEDIKAYQEAKTKEEQMEIMRLAKINAINFALKKYQLKAFMSGIRWDEHEARSKEKYFSPRPTHLRIHPLLHFTLEDIWRYIRTYHVPYVSLYDQGYKSLGEAPFTKPVIDPNAPERAGREATKEKIMEKLRKLGYW